MEHSMGALVVPEDPSPLGEAPVPEDSRQRILNAALELMSERGYAGTSISMITKRSGISASSTYWHFDSKESLLMSVVEYSAKRWLASLPRWELMSGTPTERLSELLDRVAETLASQPFLRVLMLLALEQASSEESMAVIRRVRHTAAGGFRKAFAEIFTSSEDEDAREFAGQLAAYCLAVTDGIFLASEIDGSVDLRQWMRFLRTSFMSLGVDFMARRDDAATHRNSLLDHAAGRADTEMVSPTRAH
jgi:AcrR family transcriptional regulator